MFGLTITNLERSNEARDTLRSLAAENQTVPLIVRIVFDHIDERSEPEFEGKLTRYRTNVEELRRDLNICVMGEIADSEAMVNYIPDVADPRLPLGFDDYEAWTRRLVSKMGPLVDVWEFGNEVNGEWTGWKGEEYKGAGEIRRAPKREKIGRAIFAAYRTVKEIAPNALTAITLIYNQDQSGGDCSEFPEYRMNDWAARYLDPEMRSGVDFVLLSYYENSQDCPGLTAKADERALVFDRLRPLFPADKTAFGFGEVGYKATCFSRGKELSDEARVNNGRCQTGQLRYLTDYYGTSDKALLTEIRKLPPRVGFNPIRFVGGYFYWYFLSDMVWSNNTTAGQVKAALRTVRRTFRQ